MASAFVCPTAAKSGWRGIESAGDETTKPRHTAALAALIADRDVTLLWPDDTPDRYGRQSAIVMLGSTETTVQGLLLRQGDATVSAEIADKDRAAELGQAEAEARQAKKGVWIDAAVTKNTESSGNILARIGQFVVVEGWSCRFGRLEPQLISTSVVTGHRALRRLFQDGRDRRWSQRGISLKSLENRRIRVRGCIEARPGPRIDVLRVGQIEVVGGN